MRDKNSFTLLEPQVARFVGDLTLDEFERSSLSRALAASQRESPLGLFPDRSTPRLYDRVVETTIIYTHVLNKGGRGVTSPFGLDPV